MMWLDVTVSSLYNKICPNKKVIEQTRYWSVQSDIISDASQVLSSEPLILHALLGVAFVVAYTVGSSVEC